MLAVLCYNSAFDDTIVTIVNIVRGRDGDGIRFIFYYKIYYLKCAPLPTFDVFLIISILFLFIFC